MNNKFIIICGSTCSGKSALAVKVAEKLNSEVISADSMCVYEKFDIGTAKPSENEKHGVIHHMIDVVSPDVNYTIADYKESALKKANELLAQKKPPIICGGTGFYIKSLLYDFSYGGSGENLELRQELMKRCEIEGKEQLWRELQSVDLETAAKLHENDVKRVIRALEIFYSTGRKKSEIADSNVPARDFDAFCIDYPRDELYERINKRVDEMLENGLVEEVRGLIAQGYTLDNNAMQGIGYKEIYAYLQGETDFNTAVETLKKNTRRYAKRQITFFKTLPRLTSLNPSDGLEKMSDRVISVYNGEDK